MAFTSHPFIAVTFIIVLPLPLTLNRLESFHSIYYVLFSKYFPNRIYVRIFQYILPLVAEFSFNCLQDLFQGIELTSGEPMFSICY